MVLHMKDVIHSKTNKVFLWWTVWKIESSLLHLRSEESTIYLMYVSFYTNGFFLNDI